VAAYVADLRGPATAAPSRSQSRSPTTTCGGCRTRSRPPRRLRRRCTSVASARSSSSRRSRRGGGHADADGMTTEERQLFDDLVDRISENKSRVLDVLAGEAPPASTDAVPTDDATPLGEMRRTRPRRRTRAPPQTRPRPRRIPSPGPKRRLAKTTKPLDRGERRRARGRHGQFGRRGGRRPRRHDRCHD